MDQKRKKNRFHPDGLVAGNFPNKEKIIVEDISPDGVKLVSTFSPIIGTVYKLRISYKKDVRILDFQATHVEDGGYNFDENSILPTGALYSIGGKLLNIEEDRKNFIMSMLYGH
jgi:hypothetical protein